jgi:Flp pilus assembly protein CpaB
LKRSNRLVLLIGALLAVVAFVGVILLLGQNGTGGGGAQPTPTPQVNATVVKSTVDIPAGTVVTNDMVTTATVPVAAATDSIPDPGLVVGKTIRQNVASGAILSFSDFVDTGQAASVTDNIPQGLRAMAVEVDQVTGVGTLIHTGDHVDLIIAMKIQSVAADPKNPPAVVNVGSPQSTVKMIIQNLKVVGTLLPTPTTESGATPPPNAASPTPNPEATQPPTSLKNTASALEIVMVAVTANQAEAIRYAQLNGQIGAPPDQGTTTITLVLRSPRDFIAVDASGSPIPGASAIIPPLEVTDGVTLKTLIQKYGVIPPDVVIK